MPDDGHLPDLALLEWSRFQEPRLVPIPLEDIRSHLVDCEACRSKVSEFQKMDELMHPYGSPPPLAAVPGRLRAGLIWAFSVSAFILGLLFLFR